MIIPDHLTCLLRNLYAGQEATVGYWKRPRCQKDEGQEEKGATEDEMLEGEFVQTPASEGQGRLSHCGSWDLEELDMTQ